METLVVSDLHLTEAQIPGPRGSLWMAYKRREFFIDDDFARLIGWTLERASGPVELVLNGDIFDFDNVLQLPPERSGDVDWLARLRGLGSEEWMSLFKLECILRDHPVWLGAMRELVARGHRAVFVIGNHDAELCWPSVQQRLREALCPAECAPDAVRFCSWFYLSGDTFISHGHQYDPNCSVPDPIDPLIVVRGRPRVRIPFGNLAGRYMLNGMGYFNPHAADNYIMTARQYVRFFFRYMLRTQPLLLWTWFWSAIATLLIALGEYLRPPLRDPLRVEENVREVARAANATPTMVRQLSALHVPSACTRPWALMRELWLDRGFLLLALMFAAWQVVLHVNIAAHVSPAWVLLPMAMMLPPWAIYARSVKPTVFSTPLLDGERAELLARITGARRAVFGHTHRPERTRAGPVEVFNGGFWSAAFAEPECKQRIGTQTFVTVRSAADGASSAALWEWSPGALAPRVLEGEDALPPPPDRLPEDESSGIVKKPAAAIDGPSPGQLPKNVSGGRAA